MLTSAKPKAIPNIMNFFIIESFTAWGCSERRMRTECFPAKPCPFSHQFKTLSLLDTCSQVLAWRLSERDQELP
jgi:hypothetical protein